MCYYGGEKVHKWAPCLLTVASCFGIGYARSYHLVSWSSKTVRLLIFVLWNFLCNTLTCENVMFFACTGHCPVCNHYTVNMRKWRWGGTPCILNISTRWTHQMDLVLTDTKKVLRSWMLLPKYLCLFLGKGLCEELKVIVESISTYRWSQDRWLKVHGVMKQDEEWEKGQNDARKLTLRLV